MTFTALAAPEPGKPVDLAAIRRSRLEWVAQTLAKPVQLARPMMLAAGRLTGR